MSVTVHQILNDAKRLVSRLREHDSAADNIISQTQTLYKNVEAMKEYYEDVSDHRPLVVLSMKDSGCGGESNRHILDLERENRELRDLLEDHQSVLRAVMTKYRQRITTSLMLTQDRSDGMVSHCSSQELQEMADRICSMAGVMRESVELDDLFWAEERERIAELMTEHRGLRELLHISSDYGSLEKPLLTTPPDTLEKATQTDNNDNT